MIKHTEICWRFDVRACGWCYLLNGRTLNVPENAIRMCFGNYRCRANPIVFTCRLVLVSLVHCLLIVWIWPRSLCFHLFLVSSGCMIVCLLFFSFRCFVSFYLLEMCVNNGRHNNLNRDKRKWVRETDPQMKFDNETILSLGFSIGKISDGFSLNVLRFRGHGTKSNVCLCVGVHVKTIQNIWMCQHWWSSVCP